MGGGGFGGAGAEGSGLACRDTPLLRRSLFLRAGVDGPVEVLAGPELDGSTQHEPALLVECLEDVAAGADVGERTFRAWGHGHRLPSVDIDRERALTLVENDQVAFRIERSLVACRESGRYEDDERERTAGESAHPQRW